MSRPPNPESESEIAARLRLREVLVKARTFLERVYRSVTHATSQLALVVKEAVSHLWTDADGKLQGVIESQSIGNPKWRRDVLADTGVFGEELNAKDRIFEYFLEERRFLAVLRFLASLFGSLSKAFPVLSSVKEFIDAVLCARDWLPNDPEITSLGDLR